MWSESLARVESTLPSQTALCLSQSTRWSCVGLFAIGVLDFDSLKMWKEKTKTKTYDPGWNKSRKAGWNEWNAWGIYTVVDLFIVKSDLFKIVFGSTLKNYETSCLSLRYQLFVKRICNFKCWSMWRCRLLDVSHLILRKINRIFAVCLDNWRWHVALMRLPSKSQNVNGRS